MKSNQWPGAYAYSNGKQFDNIYIGWGQKHSADGHNQPFPQSSMEEFVTCEEVVEEQDPSLEQEQEAKLMEELANKSADNIERSNTPPHSLSYKQSFPLFPFPPINSLLFQSYLLNE